MIREVWFHYDEVRLLRFHLPKWRRGQGVKKTDIGTDRQTNLIGHTRRPKGLETTHIIRLGFSRSEIQLKF